MKNVRMLILSIATALILTACGYNDTADKKTENHEGHDTSKIDQPSNAAPTSSVSLKDEKLNAVYQHYIHLTTALTNSDAAEAKIAANAIEAGAKEMEGGKAIAATAAKITSAADIEAQRKAYSTLSNNMIDLGKKSGLKSGELYVDYCPMALNDKGANWLSNKKEIRNPYFGEKMMTCGEVKETIN
jgi:major membrane immunogen (membrane-anchored lipoprotein)